MSGLEKILAEIENDAKEVARYKVEKAQQTADEISKEANAEISQIKADATKENETMTADILNRAKSSSEFETRKAILAKKQELISKVIEESKQSLDTQKYFEVLLKLAKKYGGTEKASMALNKNDLDRLPKTFAKELPKNIVISKESANIKNGFLLIYDGIDINCSFDALFAEKMEELQDKAASILFK